MPPPEPPRDIDPSHWHPRLIQRWPRLAGRLLAAGVRTLIWEGYRSDARQAWLYGQGRTAAELIARGLDPALARPGARVTNAWTARLSAHGVLVDGVPAAAALDLVPLGADGRPWTRDDPWDDLLKVVRVAVETTGLRHFAKPGKPVWDKPHVQLIEWSDAEHRLVLR